MALAFLSIGKKKTEESGSEKEQQPKNSPKQEIPDELPTLSQDVLNEAIPDKATSNPNQEDIPDELPSLDLEVEKAPEKPKQEKEALEKPALEPLVVKQSLKAEAKPSGPSKPLSAQSYFYKIADKLKQKQPSEDILKGMKNYWDNQKFEEEELKTQTQKELDASLREKIIDLQELEAKWVEQRRELEHAKNMITSIEADISINSEELRTILDKLEKVESIYNKIKNQPKEQN